MKIKLKQHIEIEAEESILKEVENTCIHKNPKYDEALRQGYSVRKIDRFINLSSKTENGLIIPIGMKNDLLRDYPYTEITDQRIAVLINIPFIGELRPYQELFINQAINAYSGVIVAATGAGKTVSGIALSSRLQQRTLILVKSKDLAEQWCRAIKQFTDIPEDQIGLIGSGKYTEGKEFTIGLIQTLSKRDLSQLHYGLVLADECHNLPASQAYKVINAINAKYKYGLSATPNRRDNLEMMIFAGLGNICAEIKPEQLQGKVLPVVIYPLKCPFDANIDSWTDFIGALVNNEHRNDYIVRLTQRQSKSTIILTSQVKHAEILNTLMAERGLQALLIHGQLPVKTRSERMQKASNTNLIIGTAQLLGEGIDWPHLEVLIFASPMSAVINKTKPAATKLIQSIGRCRRPYPGKTHAIVIDLIDQCSFGVSAYNKRKYIYDREGFKVAV